MSTIIFLIGAFLFVTGLDMTFNYAREKGSLFPWTRPMHDFIIKLFDQHNF